MRRIRCGASGWAILPVDVPLRRSLPRPAGVLMGAPLRYVALGDSYTIGTAAAEGDRWPNQLVARRARRDPELALVANLAVNGATSQDVVDRQLPVLDRLDPGFISLLVGVNDAVRGVPVESFERNATAILDRMLAHVGAARLVVVSTPDYTVTPQGSAYGDPVVRAAAIVMGNDRLGELARQRDIAFVDILDLSRRAAADPSLVADDGLHPSGAQYRSWMDRIGPAVDRLLHGPAKRQGPAS